MTTFVDARVAELRRALSARLVSRVAGPDAASHRAQIVDAPGDRWFAEDSPVRVIHEDTAMFVGGRPYAASDPHLLLWVHLAEVESFVTAHRVYGATRLWAADYDRYVAEKAGVAVALGPSRRRPRAPSSGPRSPGSRRSWRRPPRPGRRRGT